MRFKAQLSARTNLIQLSACGRRPLQNYLTLPRYLTASLWASLQGSESEDTCLEKLVRHAARLGLRCPLTTDFRHVSDSFLSGCQDRAEVEAPHEFWNLNCLRWQFKAEGHSWGEACRLAVACKARREEEEESPLSPSLVPGMLACFQQIRASDAMRLRKQDWRTLELAEQSSKLKCLRSELLNLLSNQASSSVCCWICSSLFQCLSDWLVRCLRQVTGFRVMPLH